MKKTAKSKAEERFAAIRKRDKQALNEKEKTRMETAKHVANLRALRLARETTGKDTAVAAAKADVSVSLPQAHRHS